MRYPKFIDDLKMFKKSNLTSDQIKKIKKYKDALENTNKFNPETVSHHSVGAAFLCEWILVLLGGKPTLTVAGTFEEKDNIRLPTILDSRKGSMANGRNKFHTRTNTF